MFSAVVRGGRITLTSPNEREKARLWCEQNEGARLDIVPQVEENRKQRGYFEGGLLPLITYYQEGLSHRNRDDVAKVREWLKIEFNSDFVSVDGVVHKVARSTKGKEVLQAFMDRVQAWVVDNYAPPIEAMDTKAYKRWRDEVRPFGGPDNFIDYLRERKILA